MNLPQQHKYVENEKVIFQTTKQWNPKNIVELGYGSGALTVAMSYAVSGSVFYSYDLVSPAKAISRIEKRNLNQTNKHNFIQGDVFSTYLISPSNFDLLIIDIDNTWSLIYDIVIKNSFINNKIKQGSKVIIEGGANLHPRMNINTLNDFYQKINQKPFTFKHIAGSRTSISILELL